MERRCLLSLGLNTRQVTVSYFKIPYGMDVLLHRTASCTLSFRIEFIKAESESLDQLRLG